MRDEFTIKALIMTAIKWIILPMTVLILAMAYSINGWAGEFYVEAGTLYTEDRIWINNKNGYREESGLIGHIAVGYEIRENNLSIDFQLRHESDPTQSGEKDLTNKNAIGVMSRYRF